ncbi:hypothetical protein SARC_10043, partial [Sphaeroforma arctica JP610]
PRKPLLLDWEGYAKKKANTQDGMFQILVCDREGNVVKEWQLKNVTDEESKEKLAEIHDLGQARAHTVREQEVA